MKQLTFDSTGFLAGGKRIFLSSGDIHYFRVPRDQWRDRLEKFKAVGGNCVSTYIPWMIYEPEEGIFLDDNPQYDLEAFLKLCAEMDLWVAAHPGPYQYSELNYGGLPGWIFDKPTMRALRADGTPIGAVSYLAPDFLACVRKWYRFIIPKIARHQTTNGGSVATIQFDNELMGCHEWLGSFDHHPDAMGVGRDAGRWPDFLQTKYGSLAAVREAYGLDAKTWSEVKPLGSTTPVSPAQRRLVRDYQECYFRSVADFAETMVAWMREDGMNVKFIHNAAGPTMNAYFNEMVERLGTKDFLLGVDHYYNLDMDWDQNNPTPKYGSKVFYSLEMLRHRGHPPTVFEMPGGSLSDFPPITALDSSCAFMLHAAYGLKGYNIYIFAGGPNPGKCGCTGDLYDFGAAVSPVGELREHYYAQQRFASFLHDHNWLTTAHRVHDCQIASVWDYARSNYHCKDRQGGLLFSNLDAFRFMRKGLMMTSFCASLSPNMVDLENGDPHSWLGTPLMVASATSMPRRAQENLVAFLEAGGKLLVAPLLPTLDENFLPCTVLADFLGGSEQLLLDTMSTRVNGFGVENIYINKSKYEAVERPQDSVVTLEDEVSGKVMGWRKTLPSGGAVSLLGVEWIQSRAEHEQMLTRALAELGAEPRVRCSNRCLWTSLRTDGTHHALFVINLLTAPMQAELGFRDTTTGGWVDVGSRVVPGMSVHVWMDGAWV